MKIKSMKPLWLYTHTHTHYLQDNELIRNLIAICTIANTGFISYVRKLYIKYNQLKILKIKSIF